MPINRLVAPTDPPTANADWTRLAAIVSALALQIAQPLAVVGSNVVKGAVFQIGGTVYLAVSDTAISGTASPYVKITPSGDGSTCSAAYVSSLTGVTWSSTFNGWYDTGSPASFYVFDEGKAYTAGQIAAIMNTKNEVIPLGAGVLAVLANAIGANWPAALGAAYTEPTDRIAADALKQNLPSTSTSDPTDFPVGTTLMAEANSSYHSRSQSTYVYKKGTNNWQYTLDGTSGSLAGTWLCRGGFWSVDAGMTFFMVQRVA